MVSFSVAACTADAGAGVAVSISDRALARNWAAATSSAACWSAVSRSSAIVSDTWSSTTTASTTASATGADSSAVTSITIGSMTSGSSIIPVTTAGSAGGSTSDAASTTGASSGSASCAAASAAAAAGTGSGRGAFGSDFVFVVDPTAGGGSITRSPMTSPSTTPSSARSSSSSLLGRATLTWAVPPRMPITAVSRDAASSSTPSEFSSGSVVFFGVTMSLQACAGLGCTRMRGPRPHKISAPGGSRPKDLLHPPAGSRRSRAAR